MLLELRFFYFIHVYFCEATGSMQYRPSTGHRRSGGFNFQTHTSSTSHKFLNGNRGLECSRAHINARLVDYNSMYSMFQLQLQIINPNYNYSPSKIIKTFIFQIEQNCFMKGHKTITNVSISMRPVSISFFVFLAFTI